MHDDAADQFGRKRVEAEASRQIFRCDLPAVDENGVELRAEAAHGDRLTFTAGAVDGHTADTLERLGEVGVRKLADVFRGDRIDDAARVAFDIPRSRHARADAGNCDFFQYALLDFLRETFASAE